MRRFSSEELYKLRNEIPIEWLITEVLRLPSRTEAGVFRFICPECTETTAAVNPNVNLARCFRCQRNFNTIELTMSCRSLSFIDSVRLLMRYRAPHRSASLTKECAKRLDEPLSVHEILHRIGSEIKR